MVHIVGRRTTSQLRLYPRPHVHPPACPLQCLISWNTSHEQYEQNKFVSTEQGYEETAPIVNRRLQTDSLNWNSLKVHTTLDTHIHKTHSDEGVITGVENQNYYKHLSDSPPILFKLTTNSMPLHTNGFLPLSRMKILGIIVTESSQFEREKEKCKLPVTTNSWGRVGLPMILHWNNKNNFHLIHGASSALAPS